MSELHHWYDRTAVADRIVQPPFADLADRGRRRVRRTRTVQLAGVAALATLVAAPLLVLPGGDGPNTPGAVAPGDRTWGMHNVAVTFHDLRNGLVQYLDDACGTGWVSVTSDGGMTWTELRHIPTTAVADTGAGAGCTHPAVMLLGEDTLLAGAVPPSDQAGEAVYISHDAGGTWQWVTPRVRSADAVPDGIVPMWRCDEPECRQAGLGWYDPSTGDWMVLRHQPPGTEYVGVNVGFDGSLWLHGSGTLGDADFRLAVSRDRGRSWRDATPRADIDWIDIANVAVLDADTAYLYPTDRRTTEPFEAYRTTDGGRTWQPVPGTAQLKDIVFVWVNRDGGLGVADRNRNQFLSSDGGLTFAPVELPVWGPFEVTGGLQGYPVDYAAADPVDVYLSEDGLSWQPVQIPYYQRS